MLNGIKLLKTGQFEYSNGKLRIVEDDEDRFVNYKIKGKSVMFCTRDNVWSITQEEGRKEKLFLK